LVDAAQAWRPDLVVVEPVEHAGRILAAAAGLPLVVHGWGFTLPAGTDRTAADGLADLYRRVAAEPAKPRFVADLGLQRLQAPDSPSVARFAYVPWSTPGDALPPVASGTRRVLITLGTYVNSRAARQIRLAVSAALAHGVDVVVVLGNADRDSGEAFPPNVTVVRWTDMPAAVASSDLVVHHGGAGTSWTALAAGRPSVVMPQGADQFDNARLLASAGTALVAEDAADLASTIGAALDDSTLRGCAQQVAAENAQLPAPDDLAAELATIAGQ
jgi:UDP:flavonoid glycosyltransferase YjiC (YdhE family)